MTTSLKSAGRITGMFFSVVLLGGVCFAEPGVTFSLEAGPPGASISVSGSGFPASTQGYRGGGDCYWRCRAGALQRS
jgi:hypothetical protein